MKYKNVLLGSDSAKRVIEKFVKRYSLAAPIAIIGLTFIFTFLAVGSSSAQNAGSADNVTPPPVPENLKVEKGNEAFLVGHATGTQNYVCLPCNPNNSNCPNGVAYNLFTPQATLFDDQNEQIITHFFSPNPKEGDIVRATWLHSRDTSSVWGALVDSSTDERFVQDGAVAWLLLKVGDIRALAGPTGGDKLTGTTFIHRVNTEGGLAPKTGCSLSTDIGTKAFVPYKADYFFYRKSNNNNGY